MIKNYVKIAWRNLVRNRTSSVINILGLTIGLGVAMLIGLWVYDELSFNKSHKNYDRISQIMIRGNDPVDGPFINNSVQYPLATELQTRFNETFNHVIRGSWVSDYIVSHGETKLSRSGQFVDPGLPEMLTLTMTRGSRQGLSDPYSIMISSSTAKALFDDTDPIDKLVTLNNKNSLKVTGVFEDLPKNSQFANVNFFSTWKLFEIENDWIQKRAVNNWKNHFLKIYAEIPKGSNSDAINQAIKNIALQNMRKLENFEDYIAKQPEVFMHPMKNWHLYPFKEGITDEKPLRMVRLVAIIGLFVLALACINFMNLSTARSEKRAKEVGIRKTIGSRRSQLVYQFFSESFLAVIVSFVLAFILVFLSLPWFNELAAKEMQMPWNDVTFWTISALFILVTGVVSGSYPALYLSSFHPIKVLKGTFKTGRLASLPRKSLVVIQFSVSVALIICTIVVYRQLQFAKNRPVGYTREGLITLEMKSDDFKGKQQLFRSELQKTGVVEAVSESMGKVTEVVSGNDGFDWKGRDPEKLGDFGTLAVSHDHGYTAGWQFVQGRDFSTRYASDSAGVVINEAAAKYLGIAQPVGETITWKWRDQQPKPYTILGVVRDMVMESPYEPIGPTLFFVKALNGNVNWMNIRIKPNVAASVALPKIEAVFRRLVPAVPFDYKFVNDEYALKFAAEERISGLAAFFAVLAVFISCLGLFGLASFVAEQRTKEIGVRKILGASIYNLWQLLSKEFLLLVTLSLFLAIPIAYYFMHNWLQDYQYRTSLSWWIFAGAALIAILITLLTVSFQAIKAAVANPVKSLRTE